MVNENLTTDSKKSSTTHRIFTIIGIILCVILAPLLIFNLILVIQGVVNPEEVPGIAGYKPMMVLTESMEDYI